MVNNLVPAHSGPFVVKNGTTVFAGNIESFIDRQVYLFGGYETGQIEKFISCIPSHRFGTVLDIGANVGTHTLAFSHHFNEVHAFEPNPICWSQFESNVALNELGNVRLHKVGLGDENEELPLYLIDKPNLGLGTFSTVEQYDLPLLVVATCPVRHGGRYLAENEIMQIDAVKIDVQGFEPQVLRGLADVLRRCRPVVWLEVSAGLRTKLATLDDLAALIPFDARCLEFLKVTGITHSIRMREMRGDLKSGDYILMPCT